MATGTVTSDRKIVIPVEMLDNQHTPVILEAIVDTGFNGSLTLSHEVLNSLKATEAGSHIVELGDGSIVEMESYFVHVNCFGTEREVQVIESESEPLLGMSLIWGNRVCFNAVESGEVTIQPLN